MNLIHAQDNIKNYQYDDLPAQVRQIIDSKKYQDEQLCYQQCNELVYDLNKIGWTCDYYLDAIPFDFQEI